MISLFVACVLTLLIETPFLMLCGYRRGDKVLLIVCVNTATNLTMNLCFLLFLPYTALSLAIAETLVVLAEFAAFSAAWGRSLRLFFLTLAANALSFGLGLLVLKPILRLFGVL